MGASDIALGHLVLPYHACWLVKQRYLNTAQLLILFTVMVKHENFKTCDQSGFCKRNRALADSATAQGASWISPYRVDSRTLTVKDGQVTGTIFKDIEGSAEPIRLPLVISFLRSGAVRVTIDEAKRQTGDIQLRHESQARKERYNEASTWALVGGLSLGSSRASSFNQESTTIQYGPDKKSQAVIRHSPFMIDFIRDDQVHITLNGKGLMNLEHWRPQVPKVQEEAKESERAEEAGKPTPEAGNGVDESTWWEETFGGNTDSKPRGPESIGLDITFPEYEHVFGIPSHTGPLSLKETRFVNSNEHPAGKNFLLMKRQGWIWKLRSAL